MKQFMLFFSLLCASFSLTGEDAYTEAFLDEKVPNFAKLLMAEEVFLHPGSYTPQALAEAGIVFLENELIEKSATLCVYGIYRSAIDMRCGKLGDWPEGLQHRVGYALEALLRTKKKTYAWDEFVVQAIEQFEEWDRKTPRLYEENWVGADLEMASQDERTEITEKFYREIQEGDSEGEASCFSLNKETRVCCHDPSGLSFVVPHEAKVFFQKDEEDVILIGLSPKNTLCIDHRLSSLDYFEDRLQDAIEIAAEEYYNEYDDTKEVSQVIPDCFGPQLRAFQMRSVRFYSGEEEPYTVIYAWYFLHGSNFFELTFECRPEEEKQYLEQLQPLLGSIKF